MTSALGWNPKISVVGSRKGSTVTSETQSKLPANLVIPEKPIQRDLDQFNKFADELTHK
jgi:hypothetical protein